MEFDVLTRDVRGGISFVALAAVVLAACGGEPDPPTYESELYAWEEETFSRNVSEFSGAQQVRVSLTQPSSGTVVRSSTHDLSDRSASLPDLGFGEDLRMEFQLLNFSQEIVASGATPTFDSGPDTSGLSFEVLVAEPESFAPVGGLYEPGGEDSIPCESNVERDNEYCQSRFDGRGVSGPQHRAGHTAVKTEDGRILYVGGGVVDASTLSSPVPDFDSAFDQIQVFTPSDGYVTNLAYESSRREINEGDTLIPDVEDERGRAFAEVTPLGDGEFLVTGGYEVDANGNATPVARIELIDLDASAGDRVRRLSAAEGGNLRMKTARARHTATYLPVLDVVVVAGGVTSSQTATDSIEIINLTQRVSSEYGTLSDARFGHEAVRLEETGEGSRIWLVGGRGEGTVRASTEFITIDANRELSVSSGSAMGVSRYNFSLLPFTAEESTYYLAVGGYTSTGANPQPTDSVEVGQPSQSETWLGSLSMQDPRGGAKAVRLPGDRGGAEVIVVGGRNASGRPTGNVEKIAFSGEGQVPFSVNGLVGQMVTPRYASTVNLASNGQVVLAGGVGEGGAMVNTLEYFVPPPRDSFANQE